MFLNTLRCNKSFACGITNELSWMNSMLGTGLKIYKKRSCISNNSEKQQQQQQHPFNGPLSGTIRMSWYQKRNKN